MDQPPTVPTPFDPPGPDDARYFPGALEPFADLVDDTEAAPTDIDPTEPDRTPPQSPSAIRRGRRWRPVFLDEAAFQSLREHLATVGLAVLIAMPIAFVAFFGLGALRFAVDDRTLWNSVAHSMVQFWYVLVAFVLVAFPPAMVAVRRGGREAADFIADRGYWKVLVIAFVVVPALAALVAFIVGHVLLVLIILVVLIVILVHTGGF